MKRLQGPLVVTRFNSTLSTTLKQSIQTELKSNIILKRIWESKQNHVNDHEDSYNALNTLPIHLKSKKEIFADTRACNPEKSGVPLQLKQIFEYTRALLGFYKTGIRNVWNNGKYVRELKRKYYVEEVGLKGVITGRQFKNADDLVEKIAALKSLENIERSVLGNSKNVLAMTRHEFQTVLRTEKDYYKIPLFCLVLGIFAEMTPVLCYMIPEITPSTCILPSLIKRLYHKENVEELTRIRLQNHDTGKLPVKNYENLSIEEVRLLVKIFRLKARMIPVSLFPESILRQRLRLKILEFEIDNDFLIKSIWTLKREELIKVCLDRGLIFGLDHSDDELRLRLIQQLANIDENLFNCNIYGLNYLEKEPFTFRNFTDEQAKEILSLELPNDIPTN